MRLRVITALAVSLLLVGPWVYPEAAPRSRYKLYQQALKQADRLPLYSSKLHRMITGKSPAPDSLGAWNFLGPSNFAGRTRALAADPTDANVLYAGAAGGGVWKTIDGGASWTPLTDLLPVLSVNALAIDPANPSIVYAGTGEGFVNLDAINDPAGIFKSTDGGASWNPAGAIVSNVHEIAVSPNDSQRIWAAADDGIYRSTDGGSNWNRVQAAQEGCNDIAVTTTYVFATCGLGRVVQAAVWRSPENTSVNFNTVRSLNGLSTVAAAPSNPAVVYAASAANVQQNQPFENGIYNLYRSTDSGTNWTEVLPHPPDYAQLKYLLLSDPAAALCGANTIISHGFYSQTLAVDPVNPNRVWMGGIDLFRSDDGGVNWGLASHSGAPQNNPRYLHAEQHSIVFAPGYDGINNKTMYVTNDGGIFSTSDATAATATGNSAPCDNNNGSVNWTPLNNGYASAQFFHGQVYPDGTTYFGGTVGNGTLRGSDAGGPGAWTQILGGGNGGFVAVDPTNTNILFAENQGLSMQKSTNGGTSFAPPASGITDNNPYPVAPLVMDPNNPQILWTGGNLVWRSTDSGTTWVPANQGGSNALTAIAASPADSNVVVTGRGKGQMAATNSGLTTNSNSNWPTAGNLSKLVSSLVFDPINPNFVYATIGDFNRTPKGSQVYRGLISGTAINWTGLDGSGANALPDLPVRTIAIHPANPLFMYVGTDLGVFVTTDGGANWARENTGFANVPVFWLTIGVSGNTARLFAFTHGRGVWSVDLGSFSPPSVSITAPSDLDTVTGTILVDADASDDTGISKVEFYRDGSTLIGTDTTFPYEISWDTTTASNGSHTLTAKAYDLDNLSKTASISVTADNPITSLFFDDFDDNVVAPWTPTKGTWTESGGDLLTTTTAKSYVDAPPASICGSCQIGQDVTVITSGATVWLYGWYKDNNNYVRVELKDAKDKVTLYQKVGGTAVIKQSVTVALNANQSYNVRTTYSGGHLQVYLDNVLLIDKPTSAPALGKVTFAVKVATVGGVKVPTTVHFHQILVTP